MALIRHLLPLLISHLHPPFPPAFDLSTGVSRPPCRIFSRPAFSQRACGACAAYAVSTAHAMRECVQRGVDTVPSPHWLFNCAGGRCKGGSVVGEVVRVLGGSGVVVDVDDDEVVGNEPQFERNCTTGFAKETILSSWDPRRVAPFNIDYTNERLLKTELLVYRNPVLAVILPDREMSLYPRSKCDWDCVNEVERANATDSIQLIWVQFSDGDWTAVTTIDDLALPPPPLPVYHATGPPLMPHAVVVLGWGSVPEPHWVVQNSWGSDSISYCTDSWPSDHSSIVPRCRSHGVT